MNDQPTAATPPAGSVAAPDPVLDQPSADRIAALHASGATDAAQAASRLAQAPWDDLTWWEKRARIRRENRRADPRFKRGQLRDIILQPDGLAVPYPVRNEYAVGVETQDGEGYAVVPKGRYYLTKRLEPGPIAIHFEGNPQAIWEQTPKGLTMVMLRAYIGGTLRSAIERGNRDPLALSNAWKWTLGLIIAAGVAAIAGWLWWRSRTQGV